MKNQCRICGQVGDYFKVVTGETFDNPLRYYKSIKARVCQDCSECCNNTVEMAQAVAAADADRAAARAYQSGCDYVCGYRD
jgi:hypothetical protein